MSFDTIDWCKQAVLLIVIVYFYGSNALPCLALTRRSNQTIDNNYYQNNYQKYQDLLAQKNSKCQEVNITYQEVYSFETANYYINICQSENDFYYYRQSKLGLEKEVIVPAEAVFGGSVFQATEGRTIYFVGKDGDRYYSSVMQNTNEIVFEPELLPASPVFSRNVPNRLVNFSAENVTLAKLEEINYVGWELDSSQDVAEDSGSSICTNQPTFDSDLDGWGTLLGKSPDVASNYAVDNGHDFVYDDNVPHQASIETKEGMIINLNIATTSETIERVCVQPLADNF